MDLQVDARKNPPKERTSKAVAVRDVPVVYYDSETDDFSGITRKVFPVNAKYRYLHRNPIWRFCSVLFYRVIMTPFAFLWCKLKFRYRVVNRRAYRKVGKNGWIR